MQTFIERFECIILTKIIIEHKIEATLFVIEAIQTEIIEATKSKPLGRNRKTPMKGEIGKS